MKISDEIINKLNAYSFHDMPVESIEFGIGSGLTITLLEYNETTKAYGKIKLMFIGIEKLEFTDISLTKNSDLELYSFDYEYNDNFKCKISLLTGFGLLDFIIDVSCDSIEVTNS